ncbi:MarC family protein [Deinococcus sp.]|uniref:MarC family protein n=1 Tax=Deinococcus sp. TaxID=47478 RepID=UPI003B59F147
MLVVMDPIGLAPLYIGLAAGRGRDERRAIALKASLVAGGIILLFGLFGKPLLDHLGISLDAFRVAGGVLLFLIALDMVFGRGNVSHEPSDKDQSGVADAPPSGPQPRRQSDSGAGDISVFPLAIPLIAGPGTLASIMILAGGAHGNALLLGGVFVVTAGVLLLCYLALRLSGQIAKLVGESGIHVITRVLGVLLAALAVQYVADGVRGFFG